MKLVPASIFDLATCKYVYLLALQRLSAGVVDFHILTHFHVIGYHVSARLAAVGLRGRGEKTCLGI